MPIVSASSLLEFFTEMRSKYCVAPVDSGEAVEHCLRQAAWFLRHANPSDLLRGAIRNDDRLEYLVNRVECLDHIGFVAWHSSPPEVAQAVRAAGFKGDVRSFMSEIIAVELGRILQTPSIPTEIVKASLTRSSSSACVEVFLPRGVRPEAAQAWIEHGCAVHVGFRMANYDDLLGAADVLREEGFQTPPFANNRLLKNATENMTALYLDGESQGQRIRIEFCHYL